MASLYIHIPFCKQRCIYCDFYFVTTQPDTQPFVEALLAEIELAGNRYGGKESLETIYFGGGTPSLLSVDQVNLILQKISQHFNTSNVSECSFELNPDDVDAAYLKALRHTGIDRLSIGIQSFFEEDLKWMNRAHTMAEARNIIPMARTAGFDNFSIDLIFGIAAQSIQTWEKNLAIALEQSAPHLSTYGLTIEPRTPLYKQVARGIKSAPSDDQLEAQYRLTMEMLAQHGYEHYEVSSFAKPGFRSQHNQQYWQHANYLGLGPSAHSFWQDDEHGAIRWSNVRNLRQYEQWPSAGEIPRGHHERLSTDQLINEYIMLRLRTRDGLDLNRMKLLYQVDLGGLKTTDLSDMAAQHLISTDVKDKVQLTNDGFLICDAITERLLI